MYQIDLMSRIPIYEQIIEQTKGLILRGLLRPTDKMPSVRSLSVELTVNPNTIQRAYTELCNQGILCTVVGRGCFVAQKAAEVIQAGAKQKLYVLKQVISELLLAGYTREQIFRVMEETCEERGNGICD